MTVSKIDVLGAEYTVSLCHNSDDPRMDAADGFCDETAHEIFVENFEGEDGKPNAKARLEVQRKKVLRHEIVHAFAFESSLAENSPWAQNEEMIDWVAIQGPKIYKAWQEAGAVETPSGLGEKGGPSEQSPKWAPFPYGDFTAEQIAVLKGEEENKDAAGLIGHPGLIGALGPHCGPCPVCGSRKLKWNPEDDTTRCIDCNWSNSSAAMANHQRRVENGKA